MEQQTFFILTGMLVIVTVLMLAGMAAAARITKTRSMEQENLLMQSYMDSMQEFYAGIRDRIEATRKYRHDLARHIRTLEQLLEEHDQAQALTAYMDELKTRYDRLKHQEFCRDEIVNAILDIKKKQCLQKQIPIEIEAEDEIYYEIGEADMVSLIYNLLDNAIVENDRIPADGSRRIRFVLSKENGAIRLYTENAVRPGQPVTFRTKKKHPENHGIGTRIIENLIQKYNGTRTLHVDEELWLLEDEILLHPAVSQADAS